MWFDIFSVPTWDSAIWISGMARMALSLLLFAIFAGWFSLDYAVKTHTKDLVSQVRIIAGRQPAFRDIENMI